MSDELAGLRILFVDDDPTARELFYAMLGYSGATVTAVGSGQEALDFLRESAVDVLVSDIRMPVMDGCALLRSVRQLPTAARDVPAVALTADLNDDVRRQTRDAGFQTLLTKPALLEDVVRVLRRLNIRANDLPRGAEPGRPGSGPDCR